MREIPLATYITWEAIRGRASTLQELRTKLASLPRLQVVQACAVINVVLRTWRGTIDVDEHEKLLRLFFPTSFADQLNAIARRPEARAFVFHRQQLLFLIREAIVHSPEMPDMGREFGGQFAECCLRTNDLLDHGLAMNPAMSQLKRLLPEFVTMNDFAGPQSTLHRAARTRLLLEEILNRPGIKNRAQFIDIPQMFFAATGMTVRQYFNLTFGLLTKYLKLTLKEYAEQRGIQLVSRQYFRNTQLESETIDSFLNDISATFEDIQIAARNANHLNDFTGLKNRPLLRIGSDSYFPVDIGFILDKLETGVFWRVHSACATDTQKEQLHAFWGYLFHEYVGELLRTSCSGEKCSFIEEPVFKDGGEVSDGVIVSGSNVVLMEYKASMLTANAKYSGDPDMLLAALDSKFIGTADRPKGARQLARSIARCWNKGKPETPPEISSITKVFPVLIANDKALGSPYVNKYLNGRFHGLYKRKDVLPVVTPLFVLTIDELESIAPHLGCTALHEILEAKYRSDKTLDWPFSIGMNTILKPERKSKTLEAKFDNLIDQACLDFFGRPFRDLEDEEPGPDGKPDP